MSMKKFSKFFVIGVGTTLIEYIFYTIIARVMSNDFLWVGTMVGGVGGAIFGYFLNTKYVWKDQKAGKAEVMKYFIYSLGIKTFIIKEIFTWVFSFITPVYELAYDISSFLRLPFDYDFVESTGIFGFTALATMLITYFTFDKLIFNKEKPAGEEVRGKSSSEKEDSGE